MRVPAHQRYGERTGREADIRQMAKEFSFSTKTSALTALAGFSGGCF
jgi:hypothetical protein